MYGALGGLPVNTSGWMVDAGERPAVNAATTLISTLAIAIEEGGPHRRPQEPRSSMGAG